eukprot:364009-Chlamydomonas_euryale.AAC.14
MPPAGLKEGTWCGPEASQSPRERRARRVLGGLGTLGARCNCNPGCLGGLPYMGGLLQRGDLHGGWLHGRPHGRLCWWPRMQPHGLLEGLQFGLLRGLLMMSQGGSGVADSYCQGGSGVADLYCQEAAAWLTRTARWQRRGRLVLPGGRRLRCSIALWLNDALKLLQKTCGRRSRAAERGGGVADSSSPAASLKEVTEDAGGSTLSF